MGLSDEPRDEELIASYTSGNEESFRVLVERHVASIFTFAVRLGVEPQEAEDVTQDIFLKVWKHIKKYDAGSARFRTWLLSIARNTVIDFLRKRRAVSFSAFDMPEGGNALTDALVDETPLPEELLARALDAERLGRALEGLPVPAREILHLRYREGLTFEEIGRVLGEPLNTVKSRHRRALLALRSILEQAPK